MGIRKTVESILCYSSMLTSYHYKVLFVCCFLRMKVFKVVVYKLLCQQWRFFKMHWDVCYISSLAFLCICVWVQCVCGVGWSVLQEWASGSVCCTHSGGCDTCSPALLFCLHNICLDPGYRTSESTPGLFQSWRRAIDWIVPPTEADPLAQVHLPQSERPLELYKVSVSLKGVRNYSILQLVSQICLWVCLRVCEWTCWDKW